MGFYVLYLLATDLLLQTVKECAPQEQNSNCLKVTNFRSYNTAHWLTGRQPQRDLDFEVESVSGKGEWQWASELEDCYVSVVKCC
jgi:hypothetical protein